MKYLKLFEDVNTNGFEQINLSDFWTFIFGDIGKWENFTEKEEKELYQIVKKKYGRYDEKINISKIINTISKKIYLKISIYEDDIIIEIHKLQDEWYGVEIVTDGNYANHYSYKCDQWDGLINCINNI